MKTLKGLFVAALLMLTAACGGGGGGTPPSNTVTGVAAAGIIKGGTVQVFAPYSSAGDKKAIGSGTTSDNGVYSVNIGSYVGPVIVEVFGGKYIDEATGTADVVIPETAPLRAMAISNAGTVSVAVTPLTELAARQAISLSTDPKKKVSEENIITANAQIADLFKVNDIITTQPLDASAPLVGTDAQKNYTLVLAALSQMASDPTKLDATLDTITTGITDGVMDPLVVADISAALDAFMINTNNKTEIATVPDALSDIGFTTVKLTLVLSGTGVKGIDTGIVFPAHVNVATATNGSVLSDALTNLIGGTDVSLTGTSATTGMHLIFNRADATAMPAGDIVSVTLSVDPGFTAPVSAFSLENTLIYGTGGVDLSSTASLTLAIR